MLNERTRRKKWGNTLMISEAPLNDSTKCKHNQAYAIYLVPPPLPPALYCTEGVKGGSQTDKGALSLPNLSESRSQNSSLTKQ